jgi:hypothetical protein
MSRQPLFLRDVAGKADIDLEAFCERCGASLGPYTAGLRFPQRDFVIIAERGARTRTAEIKAIKRDAVYLGTSTLLGVRGPRTQPGLYEESFGGTKYLRKRCVCPANEKRRLEDLEGLPLTIRDDGTFGVVF